MGFLNIENENLAHLLSMSSLEGVRNECNINIAICSYILKDYEKVVNFTNEV